jgi:hypothetical protein
MWLQRPTSRWRRSEVTFGPVGRLVATVVVMVPIVFAIFYSVFFIIAAAIWALTLMPWALRDIWRRTYVGTAEPSIVLPPEPAPLTPGESILDRQPPARW